MKNWILNNIVLKLLSLLLAIMVWVYISGEINKEREALARELRKEQAVRHK